MDYNNLSVTAKMRTTLAGVTEGDSVWGLCAPNDRYIITVEGSTPTARHLHLYEVTAGTLTLLDSVLKLDGGLSPRWNGHGHIYVPHKAGVTVIRIVDNRYLHVDRILTGGGRLESVWGVTVVNDTTLCVTVTWEDNPGVYLLDITSDTGHCADCATATSRSGRPTG